MKRHVSGLIVVVTVASSAVMLAHHSQVAVYKPTEEQRIEGTLAQVLIRSPHSWVHVEAKDETGQTIRYAVEWSGATQLRTAGVDGKTLKAGERVRVTGRPGRNAADHRLLMVYIETTDGRWTWGNRPGEVVD
jgi:Family of unknown function (DUF6152)